MVEVLFGDAVAVVSRWLVATVGWGCRCSCYGSFRLVLASVAFKVRDRMLLIVNGACVDAVIV